MNGVLVQHSEDPLSLFCLYESLRHYTAADGVVKHAGGRRQRPGVAAAAAFAARARQEQQG